LSKHVIGISGSPRENGNTDVAVRTALAEVAGPGVDTEFIRIYDRRIESCRGCRDCMRLGRCVITDDDVEGLLAELIDADGLVIGAPVYWDGPPGKMKDFIDRSHGYYASRGSTMLSGLRYSLISVATASGFESHEDVMTCWIDYYGAELVSSHRIYAREKGDLQARESELSKARTAGRELLERIRD